MIYVGKAKNLRNRLVYYFQAPENLHPRTRQMVFTASCVQWTVVRTEVEALALEFTWIKEFDPRFNVMFKDDKTYPYLAVTMGEEIPRVHVTRQAKKAGTRYFGPYTQVWAIRETIDLLSRVYPVRTCSPGVLTRAKAQGRPCLLADIGKCAAPCIGKITIDEHRLLAQSLCDFMEGRSDPVVNDLKHRMSEAAAALNFEEAATLRDDLKAIETVLAKSTVVLHDNTDADVFALEAGDLDAAVHVFHVRGGRIRGTRGWVIDRLDEADDALLMARLLEQVYSQLPPTSSQHKSSHKMAAPSSIDDIAHTPTHAIPREILTSVMPEDVQTLTSWLGGLRGARVHIHVPQRGAKAALMGTVAENARHALLLHRTRRSSDLSERSRALAELTETLNLPTPALRIECYDVSHTMGTHQVASMVVFEDGAPRKDAYRTFTIRGEDGNGTPDDTSAITEVLTRRFTHLRAEESECHSADAAHTALSSGAVSAHPGRVKRFSYRPDLVVVDGGLPQVNAARRALDAIGVDVVVVGLAKRLEEVWIPGEDFPLIMPRTCAGLHLLQYLRDESHRFAITKHRLKRTKAQTRSVLDTIPGLGPARQSALLRAFGSVTRLRRASVEEIASVKGIGPQLAKTICAALISDGDPSSTTLSE